MANSVRQKQLGLPLRLADFASFENYVAGASAEAVAHLRSQAGAATSFGVTLLFGANGVGKTHLLHAAVRTADSAQRALFVAADEDETDARVLEDASSADLVCVDDVHTIAGQSVWEQALFALIERSKTTQAKLVFSSSKPIAECGFSLKDLASRLGAGQVFQIQPLDDEAKQHAIKLRAKARGFDMSDDVVQYIFNRLSRDTGSLFALLDRIDEESISAGRKVTVPFVSELLKTFRLERISQ